MEECSTNRPHGRSKNDNRDFYEMFDVLVLSDDQTNL